MTLDAKEKTSIQNGKPLKSTISKKKLGKSSASKKTEKNETESETTRTTSETHSNKDDDFNILDGLGDEDVKKRWVEEYVDNLPQIENLSEVAFDEKSVRESDTSSQDSSKKSNYKLNEYLHNNMTFFQKKNLSFNEYQLWKIRRDNAKIGERLVKVEHRRLSKDYFRTPGKQFTISGSIHREPHFIRINGESKISCS